MSGLAPVQMSSVGVSGSPALFLHIPKTAGTSFILMLQNMFGDCRVKRIRHVGEDIQPVIDHIVATQLDSISCLVGHLPIRLFSSHLHRFQIFTLLRDPVARVLSLYRFLRLREPSEIARLGLRSDFSLSEMLNSTEPEIFAQVNNGIVRMLSGEARLEDPGSALFWADDLSGIALEGALSSLDKIEFGLAEDMPNTLKLLAKKWLVPYQLREYRENATENNSSAYPAEIVSRIERMNEADRVLHAAAQRLFRARCLAISEPSNGSEFNSMSVFQAVVGQEYSIGDVPGRQGFHEFETDGLAWLRAGELAEINFFPVDGKPTQLELTVFCVVPSYPLEKVIVSLNGSVLRHSFTFQGQWARLRIENIAVRDGLNKITLATTENILIKDLNPNTGDQRALGVAVGSIVLRDITSAPSNV